MPKPRPTILWLQSISIVWMLLELSLSAIAAARAHSLALLAFSSDSLVELLSGVVVFVAALASPVISNRRAATVSAVLLFVLAFIVAATSALALVFHRRPETSALGIGVTIAALLGMPVLAWLKRREARRTGNIALAADAVQSATCAWIALLALVGLALNAAFHVSWADPVAALAIVPLLIREGRSALHGDTCVCC